MGVCLDKPVTEKLNAEGEGNGLRYGAAAMQGWRVEMEDAHCACTGLGPPELADWSYFAVFDGHAGKGVSTHCSTHLLERVTRTEEWRRGDTAPGIRAGFLKFDEEMRELPETSRGSSGSTAVCAFISPDRIYVANCGDSRAVLCRNGSLALTTRDHKPALPEERERIQSAGGSVVIGRVNGSLAVSRALGDYAYKATNNLGPCEQLVSPEPEILVLERDPRDEFLLLACDGVWDVMASEDACAYVRALLAITHDLTSVTNRLIESCFAKGSYDNMTVVLVVFPGAPGPTAEAQRCDQQLEETICRRISELAQQGERNSTAVKAELRLLPHLLPGGGIHDKWLLIEEQMEDLGITDNEGEAAADKN